MNITADISLGELFDKISILMVKLNNIKNTDKLNDIRHEYETLSNISTNLNIEEHVITDYINRLHNINKEIWDIEDNIRKKEALKEFDKEFIELARSVYYTNDKRFEVKNEINKKYGSGIKEQKEYQDYK